MEKNWYRYISKIEVAYMIRTQTKKKKTFAKWFFETKNKLAQTGRMICFIQLNQIKRRISIFVSISFVYLINKPNKKTQWKKNDNENNNFIMRNETSQQKEWTPSRESEKLSRENSINYQNIETLYPSKNNGTKRRQDKSKKDLSPWSSFARYHCLQRTAPTSSNGLAHALSDRHIDYPFRKQYSRSRTAAGARHSPSCLHARQAVHSLYACSPMSLPPSFSTIICGAAYHRTALYLRWLYCLESIRADRDSKRNWCLREDFHRGMVRWHRLLAHHLPVNQYAPIDLSPDSASNKIPIDHWLNVREIFL